MILAKMIKIAYLQRKEQKLMNAINLIFIRFISQKLVHLFKVQQCDSNDTDIVDFVVNLFCRKFQRKLKKDLFLN